MKKNRILIIGIILMIIGLFLPSIRIANENINFLKETGILPLLLVAAMAILLKLQKKEFIYIPSAILLVVIVKFIVTNINRLKQINNLYGSYAEYQYGLVVLIIGNVLVITALTIQLLNTYGILSTIKEKLASKKQKEHKIIKTKEKNKKLMQETTKDGKIKFNKITVKVENKMPKQTLKSKIMNIKLKKKTKKLSITKFDNEKIQTNKKLITTTVPVIDIQKWTRSSICCSNCGATVKTTSDYCFLCDCKIKLKEKDVNYTQNV